MKVTRGRPLITVASARRAASIASIAVIVQYALMTGLMRSMRSSTVSINSTGDRARARINRDSSVAGV